MPSKNIYWLIILLINTLLIACGGNSDADTPTSSPSNTPTEIKLLPCKETFFSSIEKARLQNYTYTNNKAMFTPQGIRLGGIHDALNTTGTPKKTKKGIHLHLNLNNKEHFLSNENVFDCPVADGSYKLYAFIANSSYESIKIPHAILGKQVEIKGGQLVKSSNLPNIDIIYNAPRGDYQLGEPILVDFSLWETTIAEGGNSVRITLNNGTSFEVNEWKPYYLEGVSEGTHTLKLELLDKQGKQIAAPASHSFTVKRG